jgi:MFS superfamily sulfate permease-like transporter
MHEATSPPPPAQFGRHDIVAGLLVAVVALPLCLGIALASGFPPIAGVVTAVVGGLVAPLFGSAPLTIKGPAAGLIVVVLGAVQDLGNGDAVVGYRATLAVGVAAALLQIALALGRVGSLADMFPTSVLQGMLAAIGIILFSRQAHVMLGVTPPALAPLGLLVELPASIARANLPVVLIALASVAVLVVWPRVGWRAIPAPLVVLVVAIPLGLLFGLSRPHAVEWFGTGWLVGPALLVQLPAAASEAIVAPDFSRLLSSTSLPYVVMLAVVGSVESILSARAVDALDPWRRQPDLSRDLLSVGVANLVASLIGGLPMISEIVRSSANVAAGGRTRWANAFHGAFLLGFVLVLPAVIQLVPLAALAAMLVHTAVRLASPGVFRDARHIGREHLVVMVTTLVVTLATDLLLGIVVGLLASAALCVGHGAPVRALLRPQILVETGALGSVVRVRSAAVFTGLPALRRAITTSAGPTVSVDLSDARLIDHTTLERLHALGTQLAARGIHLTIAGLDHHTPLSDHPRAARRARPPPASDR